MEPITVPVLHQWLAQAPDRDQALPLLLDARTPAEYHISHLPAAQLLPPAWDHPDRNHPDGNHPDGNHPAASPFPKGNDRDRPVVVYCSIGYRSAIAAQKLKSAGFSQVFNLSGSLFSWAAQGYPLYRGTQPVLDLHPYHWTWAMLLGSIVPQVQLRYTLE